MNSAVLGSIIASCETWGEKLKDPRNEKFIINLVATISEHFAKNHKAGEWMEISLVTGLVPRGILAEAFETHWNYSFMEDVTCQHKRNDQNRWRKHKLSAVDATGAGTQGKSRRRYIRRKQGCQPASCHKRTRLIFLKDILPCLFPVLDELGEALVRQWVVI